MTLSEKQDNRNTILLIGSYALILFVYVCGFSFPLMEIDATTYASISKEMFQSKDYLHVFYRHGDYLDKPPLLFWTSVLSFHIFGVNDFAYRLPSCLVSLLGLYSLYRFSLLYYSKKVGETATIIAASCQAYFLWNNDVRTDTLLTGFIMFAVWQLAEFYENEKFIHIVLGSVGIGLAMLSKGPIGLVTPVVAFSCNFIYNRTWKNFFRWQYIPAIFIIAIILLPMSIGLYEQFDAHKGKESGLKFYFWTQSFGRITGENQLQNNPGFGFLSQSFIWSFLPWTLLFILAIVDNVKEKIRPLPLNGGGKRKEIITTGGFILMLLFLSLSKYQLPHYTFIIHPFAALITANFLVNKTESLKVQGIIKYLQLLIPIVFLGLSYYLAFIAFESSIPFKILFIALYLAAMVILFLNNISFTNRVVISGVLSICSANLLLDLVYYPSILKFQSGTEVSRDMNKLHEDKLTVYNVNYFCSGDFYFNGNISYIWGLEGIKLDSLKHYSYIMTVEKEKQRLDTLYNVKVIKEYEDYHVTLMTPEFLNPETRLKQCRKIYLLKISNRITTHPLTPSH